MHRIQIAVKKCISKFIFLGFLFIVPAFAFCQSPIERLTNSFTQQPVLYNTDTFAHTVWKPVLYTDSLYTKSSRSWLYRKFFEEHLLQIQKPTYNIFADIVVDEYIGIGKRGIPTGNHNNRSKYTMMNTRGYEAGGNIGNKFYFETAIYENQGRFPGYVDSLIRSTKVIPFQNRFKNIGDGKGFDFSYSSARLVYTPNQHFLFDLGFNNNFIGDGYRSLLLSDYNTNYPYFRSALTFGHVQYSVMWSQYISNATAYTYALGYPRKWGQTYLIDWQVTKKFNASLFNAVISPNETADHKSDVGISLASPVMFLHAAKSPAGQPTNSFAGLNLKYVILPEVDIYAQTVIDGFGKQDWQKRYGWQLGFRAGDFLHVQGWNVQAEFNTVRPYTYASDTITTAYEHDGEELAHPLGANFKEGVFITDYNYKHWYVRLEAFAARYGADSSASVDYGSDIFKPLYQHTKEDNVNTDQGLYSKIYYGDLRAAYILNRKTNLRLEAGAVYRTESNKIHTYKDMYVYIGIRTSFRKLIYDF